MTSRTAEAEARRKRVLSKAGDRLARITGAYAEVSEGDASVAQSAATSYPEPTHDPADEGAINLPTPTAGVDASSVPQVLGGVQINTEPELPHPEPMLTKTRSGAEFTTAKSRISGTGSVDSKWDQYDIDYQPEDPASSIPSSLVFPLTFERRTLAILELTRFSRLLLAIAFASLLHPSVSSLLPNSLRVGVGPSTVQLVALEITLVSSVLLAFAPFREFIRRQAWGLESRRPKNKWLNLILGVLGVPEVKQVFSSFRIASAIGKSISESIAVFLVASVAVTRHTK